MLYILDTANINDIKHANEFYPLAGVTTNPSIIAKENTDFWALVKEIRSIIGPDKLFFAQTVQTTADKIVEEAKLMNEKSGGEFCVKIPICEEGLKATMAIKKLGIKDVKAVYTEEEPIKPSENPDDPQAGFRRSIPASNAFVPSVAGLIAAGEVIKELAKIK